MLLLHDLVPLHWAWAGAGIALVTLVLLIVFNQRLGVSTGFENVCALVIKTAYFKRRELSESHLWRRAFLVGLLLGGMLSALLAGGIEPTWALGIFDVKVGYGAVGKGLWMFAGGILIGFGTRLAGGCTSGHGIFGMSNLEPSGIIATVSFMGAGVVTTHIIYRVLFV
jgi:uncharacterized protein